MKSSVIAALIVIGFAYFILAFLFEDTQYSAALGTFLEYSKFGGLLVAGIGFGFLIGGQPRRK
jgi:hypothetical protein